MLLESDFAEFGEKVVLYCHVISFLKDEPHRSLPFRKRIENLPHVAFLDSDGETLAVHQGPVTVAGLEETRVRANGTREELQALAEQVGQGSLEARATLFEKQAELGNLEPEQARRILDSMNGLAPKRSKYLRGLVTEIEVAALTAELQIAEQPADALVDRFLEVTASRVVPAKQCLMFWYFVSFAAEKSQDPALLDVALDEVAALEGREGLEDEIREQAAAVGEQLRAQLARMENSRRSE